LSKRSESSRWCGLVALAFIAADPPVNAQTSDVPASSGPQGPAVLEEITVTAQKRESSVQKTPAQVVAVPGSVLVEQGVTNLQAMSAFAPNFELGAEASNTQVFIRGIGQNFDAASDDPGSAVYIDQVYTPRQATTGSMFDVARLEVLPGPQGTLYGRNAAGGAVNIITNVPTNQLTAGALVELGNYADRHIFGVFNAPILGGNALQ